MKTQNHSNYCGKLLRKSIFLTLSLSTLTYIADDSQAATFHADISNFNLVMPPVITNAFAISLSRGTEQNTDPRGSSISIGNAGATFDLFTIEQTQQPSGQLPPFSDTRFGRRVTGGSVEGFANPEGRSEALSQAMLFGRLGNGTVIFGDPQDIPLTFDLSFDYNLSAMANLPLEDASAGYEVSVTGLGEPDAACMPLSLTIVANDAQAGNVTCTFSTILKAGEFRDFDIQIKVVGNAIAVDVPPLPEFPLEFPNDIVPTPEATSTISLLSLGILGAGVTLKRKLKASSSLEKETAKIG